MARMSALIFLQETSIQFIAIVEAVDGLYITVEPADQNFHSLQCSYELKPRTLRLLDFYGGAHDLLPSEYFAVDLQPEKR